MQEGILSFYHLDMGGIDLKGQMFLFFNLHGKSSSLQEDTIEQHGEGF
ncbi:MULTISPECIES: hypothetical protein [unclassified Bartonella]